MQYFAELDSNKVVLQVITVDEKYCTDENDRVSESIGEAFCQQVANSANTWMLTYATGNGSRKNLAGIGYTYDESRDAFIPPKLFDDWIFDEITCTYIPPVPKPNYTWDQNTGQWEIKE